MFFYDKIITQKDIGDDSHLRLTSIGETVWGVACCAIEGDSTMFTHDEQAARSAYDRIKSVGDWNAFNPTTGEIVKNEDEDEDEDEWEVFSRGMK